jgi:hypothetical protein
MTDEHGGRWSVARRALASGWVAPALAAGALLLGVLAWLCWPQQNLARGARVSASSSDFDTNAMGAIDGFRYGQLGFHSGVQRSPWLALDLGGPRVIARVQAYGRGDCCFDQSVPLALEVSDDGVDYRALTTREKPFTQYEPWIFRPSAELVARFVRLRSKGKQPLVLSEVEVYGHEP